MASVPPTEKQVYNFRIKTGVALTYQECMTLYGRQKGRCAICATSSNERLVIDHNPEAKEVRGLLCRTCNVGLGMFQDSIRMLAAALVYLDERGSYGINFNSCV